MPLLSLIFLLNPIAGIASWIWVALRNIDRTSWTALRGLALLLSLYLGFVNTTKELYGDFLAYNEYYRDALNSSLLQYLLLYAKEPVYYTFSWVISRLTNANWPIYVTFFTTASYMAIYEAVILIAKKTDCSKYHVITVLVFTAFFFQTFAMNGNMLRQSISQSFALLFLIQLYYNQKYNWLLAIISLGVHTASIPIIGLGIIPFIRKPMTPKRLLLLSLSIIILSFAFLSMSGLLSKVMFSIFLPDICHERQHAATEHITVVRIIIFDTAVLQPEIQLASGHHILRSPHRVYPYYRFGHHPLHTQANDSKKTPVVESVHHYSFLCLSFHVRIVVKGHVHRLYLRTTGRHFTIDEC